MIKNVGFERALGTGGGSMVSPESQKNYEIGAALCKAGRVSEAAPYLFKSITLDKFNLDAFIEIAFISPTKKDSMQFLDDGLKFGRILMEKRLGPTCFDDEHVGRFWDILDTRPYMRVLQTRVRFQFMMEKYRDAATTIVEMIRLCPGDNLDQRSWLGPALCHTKRYSDALSFAQAYLDYSLEIPLKNGGLPFKEPKRELYPADEASMQRLMFTKCSLSYTAAYAAFKLWGDCDASRQYLKIAAGGCRHVLVKILARIKKPDELNMSARTHNGTEDAHDYLYMAQSLWMAEDVWNWVSNNPDAQDASRKACANTSCANKETSAAEFQRCSSCHQVSYCGPACQKEDWKRHKSDCKQRSAVKLAVKAVANAEPMPENTPVQVYSADFSGGSFIVTEGSAPSGVVVPEATDSVSSVGKNKKKKSKKKSKK